MSAAIDLVDRMIDHGVIVSTKGAHSAPVVTRARAEGTYRRFDLVVLIDQGSASASEIVAGALQDHGRAVIVGKRSWGKGSVQRPIKLPDSAATVKLTTDYYYLPKGRCVHRLENVEEWGVTPDIEEPLDTEKIFKLRDFMEKLVIEPLTKAKQKIGEPQQKSPVMEELDEQTNSRQENDITVESLRNKLLQLDGQLAQAVKQCRGLVRARPILSSMTEILED